MCVIIISLKIAMISYSSNNSDSKIAINPAPFFSVYKDGRIGRFVGTQTVPPGHDPKTNVQSKDVVFSRQTGRYVRLYIPQTAAPSAPNQLPLLVYFHGGGFCLETASSPPYHNYLNSLVAEAGVVGVSVDYRRAPEHPIPAAYHDSWDAIKWAASHCGGNGPEQWLNRFADFDKVYFAGDSAGANIAHHMAIRIGKEKLDGVHLAGIILAHPYFLGKKPIGNEIKAPVMKGKLDELWRLACPTTSGSDDPYINPIDDPSLPSVGCSKVLVCIAEKDIVRGRGVYYCEKLKESGWGGEVEVMEARGENHVFHLQNPTCENAVAKLRKVAAFLNQYQG